jgi:hypothetical protein
MHTAVKMLKKTFDAKTEKFAFLYQDEPSSVLIVHLRKLFAQYIKNLNTAMTYDFWNNEFD